MSEQSDAQVIRGMKIMAIATAVLFTVIVTTARFIVY